MLNEGLYRLLELFLDTLAAKAIGHGELANNAGYELKESQSPYNRNFELEKCNLRPENEHFWQVS
jgi:hypothetical protein